MRLLANENIPLASVGLLREAGHDVVSVTERSPGIPDDEVMQLARDEARVIVTCDRDYGELVHRRRLPACCICAFSLPPPVSQPTIWLG